MKSTATKGTERYFVLIFVVSQLIAFCSQSNAQSYLLPGTNHYWYPQSRPWNAPERPAHLKYHTFDIRYEDGTADRVTGTIARINNEYVIIKTAKKRSAGEQIKISTLSSIEILDDIDYPLRGMKTDTAWLFTSVIGIISVCSTFEGPVSNTLPVSAISKNRQPFVSYSPEALEHMIADNPNAVRRFRKSGPLAAIKRYNEDFRTDTTAEDLTDIDENSDTPSADISTQTAEARFIGGQAAWEKYLRKNLKHPSGFLEENVHVEFTITEEGIPKDIHVLQGNKAFREEAISVIAQSGKWLPALQNGKPVASTIVRIIPFARL